MNTLNTWLKLPQMDEENPRFEEFMHLMEIKDRSEVEKFANLCAFKVFVNGACVRFNKQILSGQRKGFNLLRFVGINVDVLRFDDWFHTELNAMYLYEVKQTALREEICCHCFNPLKYDHKQKFSRCTKCEFVLPS